MFWGSKIARDRDAWKLILKDARVMHGPKNLWRKTDHREREREFWGSLLPPLKLQQWHNIPQGCIFHSPSYLDITVTCKPGPNFSSVWLQNSVHGINIYIIWLYCKNERKYAQKSQSEIKWWKELILKTYIQIRYSIIHHNSSASA